MSYSGKQVLLVEDEKGHVGLVCRAFSACGDRFEVTLAGNISQARTVLENGVPDLIIADLNLPDGKGTELLPVGDEEVPYPVVIMTAFGDEMAAVDVIKSGALDYIVKSNASLSDMPHIADRALRQWEHVLQRRRAEAAIFEAKEQWERTFDAVPDLVSIIDADHRIVRVNEAMAQKLGITPEECVGELCYRHIHGTPEPPENCPHSRTLEDGCEHQVETCEKSLGGDFLVTTSPLLDSE